MQADIKWKKIVK